MKVRAKLRGRAAVHQRGVQSQKRRESLQEVKSARPEHSFKDLEEAAGSLTYDGVVKASQLYGTCRCTRQKGGVPGQAAQAKIGWDGVEN